VPFSYQCGDLEDHFAYAFAGEPYDRAMYFRPATV